MIKFLTKFTQSSDTRTASVKKNIVGSFLVKGISIATTFFLVPLTIDYINSELYGVWLTLSSIVAWISFFDVGFGNGLKNKLATSIALDDYEKGRSYVSTAYFCLFLIFISVGAILFIFVPWVNWSSLLNVSPELNAQLITVARIILVFFVLQMVLKVITTVIIANQQIAKASFIDAIGQLLVLSLIFILTKTTFPSLSYLALALSGAPVLVLFAASLILYNFSQDYKKLSPSLGCIKMKHAKDIMGLGVNFFIIQIAALILYQTANLIIANVDGPESVTVYNVAYKYLSIALMLFNIIMAPIWPAFTDAYTKSDYPWMNRIYHKLLRIFLLTVGILAFMLLISPFVYEFWVGDKTEEVPFSMSTIVAVFLACNIWNTIHSAIINGIGKIKLQLYLSLLASFLNIPLSFFLGKTIGAEGVVLSTIIFSILPAVFLRIQVKKLLSGKANGIWVK
jgi:Na+-driven multidrug efflux pump